MFANAKGRNKSRFDSNSVREQCIDHIPYYLSGLSRAHFSDNPSRNNCISFGLAMREVSLFLFSGWGCFCSSLSAAPRDACARVHSPHYISEKKRDSSQSRCP